MRNVRRASHRMHPPAGNGEQEARDGTTSVRPEPQTASYTVTQRRPMARRKMAGGTITQRRPENEGTRALEMQKRGAEQSGGPEQRQTEATKLPHAGDLQQTETNNTIKHKAMAKKILELTRGEEEVMQILWSIGSGFVNDIIARMKEPKPKYTTVATFIKILENKGFVRHEAVGKSYLYFPLVAKEEYAGNVMQSMLSNYFDGSLSQMVSFFSQKENISVKEMDEILEIVEKIRKG